MPRQSTEAEPEVTIYPTYAETGVYIPGVPAVEMTVPADEAAQLLAYTPPAFTTIPPQPAPGPSADIPEDPES